MRKANLGYSFLWHTGKRLVAAISLSAVLSAVPPPAGAQVVNSTKNPNQIAILHWYGANQTTQFPVGNSPRGVAFDGANIWVTNFGSNTVTKLRASDGAALGTFSVRFPVGVAFDRANIWTANANDTVTKLLASDGKTLGTFAAGDDPLGVAFDGTNIWVANFGEIQGGSVTKLRASDGKILGIFAVGSFPRGVAFDGANVWVVNSVSGTVTKLRASDGATLGTFATGGGLPVGVAFDGANIWVTNSGDSNTVSKL